MSPRPLVRRWRVAAITAWGEVYSGGRVVAAAVRLAVQLFLVVNIWRALYAGTSSSSGLTKDQAVSYAVLAVLVLRIRGTDRWSARDMVIQHVESGTIVYWFLRPLAPQRYYLLRAVGDQAYGLLWAAAGFAVCRLLGAVMLPPSAAAAAAFAITLLLGHAVLYYLTLLTDQLCFWTVKNGSAVDIMLFAMTLLSGGYAALWYFPGWFRAMSAVLPFQSTLGIPLSFYVGRLAPADLAGQVAVQGVWVLLLALATRLIWRRAAVRVVAQGG